MIARRLFSRRLAGVLVGGFVVALFAFVISGFPSVLEMQPCAASKDHYVVTLFARPLALLASIGLMLVARHDPRPIWFATAIALPVLAWSAHAFTSGQERRWQAQCAHWPLEEAFRQCRADPAWYVLGRTSHGFRQATLVARGKADQTYACLSQWAQWSGWGSIEASDAAYGPR